MTREAYILISASVLAVAPGSYSAEIQNLSPIWSRLPDLPENIGLGGCFAGESGGALLVAGGCNFPEKPLWEGGKKSWHDTVYVLEKPHGKWQRAGRLPQPLAYGVSVTARQGLLCIGGTDASRHHAEVWQLSWSKHGVQIRALPSLPMPLAYSAGALVGDTVYVTGGLNELSAQPASDKCLALDLSNEDAAWQEVESCPGPPRMLATAGVLDGTFYLAGGTALGFVNGKVERTYLRDAWSYRPGYGWRRLADLPKACSAGASPAPTLEAALFLVGGDDGSLAGFQPVEKHPGFSRRLLAYHSKSDAWSIEQEAPFPSATVQTTFWFGRYVFAGGETRPGVRSSQVWTLGLSSGK